MRSHQLRACMSGLLHLLASLAGMTGAGARIATAGVEALVRAAASTLRGRTARTPGHAQETGKKETGKPVKPLAVGNLASREPSRRQIQAPRN